ncbi:MULTISPECIES: FmdB family zinc ribbon protein [Micromonospora]|uniref:FmdB family transcriptional regulator n=1 Tax=Micromonospora antibiotica TaxID=2807623 RepID=A0ABS3VH56_9ACTN|nr:MULTISPECIES: FmdB family zinc ribbon protein [Micromonospora]MBO4164879.1 FmdB family transcriptional regulator [Micromonospora antibiotica]MBW4704737.1 FmdB family transcriptional regulator [Micromonospora sp. RL09-050-HVF-A]
MPTYQYACTACGHQLEAVQSFSDEPLTECPACEGRLRKVFNSVGVVFKGSGFYRTDSRAAGTEGKGGTTKPAKSEGTSSGGDSSGSGSSSTSGGSSTPNSSSSSTTSGPSGSTSSTKPAPTTTTS